MLTVEKHKEGEKWVAELSGNITQDVDFSELMGKIDGKVTVKCSQITYINSIGVKAWMSYFSSMRRRGCSFHFFECSPVLIHQQNLISNFIPLTEIESIQVPYLCKHCHKESAATFLLTELKKLGSNIPERKCPDCGKPSHFDAEEADYLTFLK
jgi:anti-anti-sigma regulatory factor